MRSVFYLVSSAGLPNLGDELIAATWLKYLAETHPDTDVVLDCIAPERTAPLLRGLHPRLTVTSVLWQLCFRHWSAGTRTRDIVAELIAAPERAADLAGGIELLRRADVVHLTGGGFLTGIWPSFAGLLSGISAVARQTGAVTAMTGVGLVPALGGADFIAELAAEFTVVDVRDKPSGQLLGGHGQHSCDDVFLSPGAWLAEPGDAPEVMVALQDTRRPSRMFPPSGLGPTGDPGRGEADEREKREERARDVLADRGRAILVSFITRTLAEWEADEIGVIECWPEADRSVWETADQLAPKVRRYPLHDILRDGLPAMAGQTWLSTRFHPHLLAAAAGARGAAVSLMKGYYGTKHESLIDRGSGWSLTSYDPFQGTELPPRPEAGGYSRQALAVLQAEKLQVAERIYDGKGARA